MLPPNWEVPEEFRRRLGEQAGRQRLMQADGHLLLVLHAPPSPDSNVREGRLFWRDPTGRWTPSGASPAQPGLGDLLGQYESAIEQLQADEDEAKTARQYFQLLNRLNPLARTARNLYETIQSAREAASDDRQLLLWRDRAYVIARAADLLHGDAKNALEFAIAERAEQEAESSRRAASAAARLNLLVACFFPVATLAAIFGVNLRHGLESWDRQYAPLPLLAMLVSGLALGLLLMLAINRRR
ncbi:MAG: hypothetical protein DCC67_19260 [Planctomycetota bacterium]|nr:MAG: hypothetical protein DCC67_19260 [Planctomycetota bacterium]